MADKHPTAPRGHLVGTGWPSYRYAQDGSGDKAVFNSEAEVPEGWLDTPPQLKAAGYQRPPGRGVAPKIDLKQKAKLLSDNINATRESAWPKPASE